MAIQYVGGRGAGRAGSTSTVNVAINSGLTGGIGAAAIAGDLVVVTVAVATQGRNPSCAVSGYTAKTQQHTTATTYDISVCTSYKIMPATPDTQVTIPSTGNIADGQGYRIMVFRGVNPTNIEDVAATYLTGSGTNNRPDPQSITPATTGAWIYFGGGGAAATGTTVFTATYLSGFASYNGADTNDGTVGAGYYSGWTSGPYNGAVWGGGSVNAANSWGCTTLALRPAPSTTPQAVNGILTSSGTVGKAISKQAVGVLASAGAVNRQTSIGLSGNHNFAGTLSTSLISGVQKAVAGIMSFAGDLGRRVYNTLTGILIGEGSVGLAVSIPNSGNASFGGTMNFTFYCLLSGEIAFSALAPVPSGGNTKSHHRHGASLTQRKT